MSAAPQPNFSVQSFPFPQNHSGSSSRQSATSSSRSSKTQQGVRYQNKVTGKLSSKHNFVNKGRSSVKLKPLFVLQRVAFGIGSCLMVSSALVYVSTVPIPQLWSQEYEQLKSLQRQERELTAANETIKNDLVKQAQHEAQKPQHQLSYVQPNDVIFLDKAQIDSESSTDTTNTNSLFESIPLGY